MKFTVRPASAADALGLARVHVESWRESYRGLMADEVLDDPSFIIRREQFWTAALTDARFTRHAVAAAILDGEIVGVAMAGPATPEGPAWEKQLYVLYTYAAVHGQGAGAELLSAVIDPRDSVALWVADPNPRAQAFYRKHGFDFDGTSKVEGGVRELRMTRLPDGPSR
ncbi:GNAT family N-acetyltransferase [Leifsonia sp. NPDC058230]|uniref:GNAT family N-acetyltransferase n=1 Tax=Leifsonia sp. NPDC058230 TaxID=3346391 RepID=UPI0036DAF31D